MEIRTEVGGSSRRLHLAGELTIYSAAECKPQLLEALAGCRELEVQAADMTEIDTAGVQVLLLVKREAVRLGKVFRLAMPSPAVQEVLTLYGLTSGLEPA